MEKKSKNPSSVRSKKALALAFAELLMERSIFDIKISDITKKAGLSRQTFYTNFEQKEDILDYSLERLFEMYRKHIAGREPDTMKIFTDYFAFWYEHRVFLSILFQSQLSYLFFAKNTEFFQRELAVLAEEAAQEAREIPYIKAYLAGTAFTLLKTWIVNGKDLDMKELTGIMERLMTGMLFT